MSAGHAYAYGSVAKKVVPPHLIPDLEILEQNLNFDKTFLEIIFKCFDQQSDPFTYALDLMFYSKDFARGKSWSLSRAVLESLKKWCKQNDVSMFLTREQKADALDRVLQQTNGTLVGLVCEIFRLKEDCEYFKLVIKELLSKKLYREAYYTITALNLEREIALEEFCYPVFFLDKDTWLKNYLIKHPDLQLEFAKTLDAVCQSSAEIQEFISSFPTELNVRRHAYDPNRLQKRLSNFTETFNIDLKECPNLFQIRTAGAMNYLFRKKYIEESIAAEPWEELVVGILEDNIVLQKELLIKLVCISDNATALKLAKIFNLNKNDWPSMLQNVTVSDSEEIESNVSMNSKSSYISVSPYLTLRLTNSDIHIVDTPDKFLDAVADISENYNVVGIDAEWKPNLGVSKEKLSLFQLAVWDSVYLLDILVLQESLKAKYWDYMIEKIFCNADILKLGYGIKTDLQMLMKLFSGEKSQLRKYPRLVDIGNFFKELKIHFPAVVAEIKKSVPEQLTDPPDSKGLSQLCYTILGKPLNKDEQFSNWERRPLRESQMTYAALDAYCLLMIYEKLYHVLRDMDLNFDKLIESPLPSKSVSENKKKSKKQLKKEIKHKPISVSDFRVVVDNMAHGLAKYLRICGADVVILDNDDDHMRAVEISQKENRIILSSGAPYEKLKGYVPEDMCFCLPIEANARVQAAAVLKHFNVLCKESDIFSRCSVCNGNHYLRVRSDELFPLWYKLVGSENEFDTPQSKQNANLASHISCSDEVVTEDGLMQTGVPIQLSALSSQVFKRVEYFFICTKCGKVYWEGSHFSRVKKYISQFIGIEDSTENIYQAFSEDSEPGTDLPEIVENGPSDQLLLSVDVASYSEESASPVTSSSVTYCAEDIRHFDEDSSDEDCDIMYYD